MSNNKDFSYLKVGDKVFTAQCRSNELKLTEVIKITPTGRIKTADELTFLPSGVQYGGNIYTFQTMKPYNDKFKKMYERQQNEITAFKCISLLSHNYARLSGLDDENLLQIIQLLQQAVNIIKTKQGDSQHED